MGRQGHHDWPSTMTLLGLEPEEEERECTACERRRQICDHRFHPLETRHGPRLVRAKLTKCVNPDCPLFGKTFSPQAEQFLAPPKLALDWDLFAWIGHRRFARHWSVPAICAELADTYKIVFSWDALESYIARYERMVAARHQDPTQLVDVYANIPDLVLSIDGLQPEKGHETLYVVRELNAGRVWFAAPLLSSAALEIEALLARAGAIAKQLGKPIRAWVSDKQEAFVTGIAKLFPGVPHRYCKIHFVRALAQETRAKDSHVKVQLRKKVRGLRAIERKALATAAEAVAEAAATAGTPLVEAEATPAVPPPAPTGLDSTAPAEVPPASVELVPSDSTTNCTATPASVVLGYCAAVRGILNDDQGTPLEPAGLRMASALEEVKGSLAVCRSLKKGGLLPTN